MLKYCEYDHSKYHWSFFFLLWLFIHDAVLMNFNCISFFCSFWRFHFTLEMFCASIASQITMYFFSKDWSNIWKWQSNLTRSLKFNYITIIFLSSLIRCVYVSSMNVLINIQYSTYFVRYCFSVVWSFFLYLNFSEIQTFLIIILSDIYS